MKEEIQMNNLIVGLGNCGCQIVKAISNSKTLSDVKLYAVDSTTASVDMNSIASINVIPIISDENEGSGRNRSRGAAMFDYHSDNLHAFDKLYEDAVDAKEPIILISSTSGGTGSGSISRLCYNLLQLNENMMIIPILVFPSLEDPDAYHLNTNDLMIELQELNIKTYCVFRNAKGDTDYTSINNDVVEFINIILGKRYNNTTKDSIDDSDLISIMSMPGRLLAVSAEAKDADSLKKEITKKVFSGTQPAWTEEESEQHTFMKAYSLTSLFANTEFSTVFEGIDTRIKSAYDEFKNICAKDNNGTSTASVIIAGLPRPEIKNVDIDFVETKGIGEGVNKSSRPAFMNRRKAKVVSSPDKNTSGDGKTKMRDQFKWE